MTHASTDQERAEFEAWCESEGLDHIDRGFGKKNDYAFVETRRMWLAWKAARRAQAVPQGRALVPLIPTDEQIARLK